MSPSENENDIKRSSVPPEPLCLFCFPEDTSFAGAKTYVNTFPKESDIREKAGKEKYLKKSENREKGKEELWLRKRTEARIRRRRMMEPIRNLKSYLLTSVKNEKVPPKIHLPSLFEVLETVKDAWPSPPSRNFVFLRNKDEDKKELQEMISVSTQPKRKDEQINFQTSDLLNRRLSMPEVLMRKYSASKERTSEESETNKTATEIPSSSSSTIETARRKDIDTVQTTVKESKAELQKVEVTKIDACQQTRDSDDEKSKRIELPKRVTQNDYYKQGRRIIKVKATHKGVCTCQREPESSTTVSAKEETDEGGTTESVPSSSPTQLPKCESSSGNLSSESDHIRCTCAELSSKETSTDLYFSGKSTLSQTVSDKSISTQDSTVSINSVSTRGSTVSDNSNSTTPEIERTSAKETTTSSDYSPSTPRNRKNRRRDKYSAYYHNHSKTCPRYSEEKHSRHYLSETYPRRCPIHSDNLPEQSEITAKSHTNVNHLEDSAIQKVQTTETANETPKISQNQETNKLTETKEKIKSESLEEQYKWAKLSQEELYMMQQLRHRKFIESQRKLSNPLPHTPDTDSMIACNTGSTYKETECIDQQIMIPRYSALPRTLSMLVNTSSPDISHNSDSDNQSLADSLEDQPITHIHKLYFDTKKESKPVRGDVSFVPDNKLKRKQPRGRAFFVSIKEPYGEDEMLENIEKIPQPPEKIKNKIFKRHLNLCTKHKHLFNPEEPKGKNENGQKKRKTRNKNEDNEKTYKTQRNSKEESKKFDRKSSLENTKRTENESKTDQSDARVKTRKEMKYTRTQFNSKIPVLVSNRSTSSSPEVDSEAKEKPERPKTRLRREREKEEFRKDANSPKQTDVETTQILEITHTGAELSLQKPQAIIHPSQIPFEAKQEPHLTIPPLVSTLKTSAFRQTWNKQFLIPARRSPIGKFRQRFEVIPEEKSSSLSSAEEKNGKQSFSKFTDASTSPLHFEKVQFHNYNLNEVPNLIVAEITKQQLETFPCVKQNDNQKIILFSSKPQNSNSSKGRNALIAMNREDFNRLARGWMNFYKLNENTDNSENEDKTKDTKDKKSESNKQSDPKSPVKLKKQSKTSKIDRSQVTTKQKENSCLSESKTVHNMLELNDNIRFDCSNTILRSAKSMPLNDSNRDIEKQNSLPELRLPSQKSAETPKADSFKSLAKVGELEDDDDTDSDSTDYMEPPSPLVPPLPIDDIPSDATMSSSDSEHNVSKAQTTVHSLKYLQFKKQGIAGKTRLKKENSSEASRFGKKRNSGWSVTVAGTLEMSRSAPDLEMRLSFPASGGPLEVFQSDSGFAEDSNYSKLSESIQDLDSNSTKKELPLPSGDSKQKWTVTVKNPKQGKGQQLPNDSNHRLPDLESHRSRNSKKVFKDFQVEEKVKRLVERKMRAIWPKVQTVIREEFLTESGRLITEQEKGLDDGFCLSVRGNAVSLERKQRSLSMTDKNVTRRST